MQQLSFKHNISPCSCFDIHLETIAEQVADRVSEVAVCRRERLHVRVFRQRLEQEQGCAHMEKGAGEVKASEENKLGFFNMFLHTL